MKHLESKLQIECVRWFRYQYPQHTLFSIPNGGARNKTEAAILKAEGVLAGVADLFLMCARIEPYLNIYYYGLFIELKTAKGKQTEKQKEFQKKAEEHEYKYEVVRSFNEFKEVVDNYLK
jgi:hypothetical protein